MRAATIALLAAIAGGCAGTPPARTFDLGVDAPAQRLPVVRVAAVRSVAPFDGVEMHYRLAWRNASELAAFAHSRWAAPPAELMRKQLLRTMGEGIAKCGLEIELQEFTQVFSSKEASEARIELRVSLMNSAARVASRGFTIVEPGAGSEAASGAAAMARATERAVSELGAWVAGQSGCA